LSGNATLYAQWTQSTNAHLQRRGRQFGRFDHRPGHHLGGAARQSFAGNTFNGGSPRGRRHAGHLAYTLSGNATLYAQWTQVNDTLTFNAEGGSSVASITAQDTTSVVLPARASRQHL